jgi:L-lactate dehydrogenase (cytochrome)
MLMCGDVVLKAETETCMRLLGVERVEQLGMQHINTRAVERDIWDGPVMERGVVKARL